MQGWKPCIANKFISSAAETGPGHQHAASALGGHNFNRLRTGLLIRPVPVLAVTPSQLHHTLVQACCDVSACTSRNLLPTRAASIPAVLAATGTNTRATQGAMARAAAHTAMHSANFARLQTAQLQLLSISVGSSCGRHNHSATTVLERLRTQLC